VRELFIQATYLAASVLFILGLRGLSSPVSARRGMNYAAIGMFFAVVGTLLNAEIITFTWIIIAMIIGSLIGAAISIFMPMTAVPQRTAISHMFGALAATLVGVSEYYRHFHGAGVGTLSYRRWQTMTISRLVAALQRKLVRIKKSWFIP